MTTRRMNPAARRPAISVFADRATGPNSNHALERKKPRKNRRVAIAMICVAAILGGCANMAPRQRNAAIGAAVGGVAGAILTDGSGIGTAGGAAVGGYIGDQVNR